MSADPPVRVLIAEPGDLHAAILATALDGDRFDVRTYSGPDDDLLDAAAGVQVLVAGPTVTRTALLPLVPRLVGAGVRLLVLADTDFDEAASSLLFAGASGFLSLRDTALTDVADAVLAIARGSTALHPDVVHEVLSRWREQRAAPAPPAEPALPELTGREAEVLRALCDGLTNRLIARRLGVAEKTVETHKSRLFMKLGARNQAQAVRLAVDRGLI